MAGIYLKATPVQPWSSPHRNTTQYLSSQSAEDMRGLLPDVNPAGIAFLAALAEVSHPAIVSQTADCDDMWALAALGTLVDFVMFVEGRARFATLIKTRETGKSGWKDEDKETQRKKKKLLTCLLFFYTWTGKFVSSFHKTVGLTFAHLYKHYKIKNIPIFTLI